MIAIIHYFHKAPMLFIRTPFELACRTHHLILGSFIKEWALSIDSWKKAAIPWRRIAKTDSIRFAAQPREKLIKDVTELNQSAYEHATKPASPEELKGQHTELFDKWKEHKIRRGR